MFKILTIDADYWYPLDQGGHCGHCRVFRKGRESCHRSASTDEERSEPSHEQISAMVRPGTPIKVTESHAMMYHIMRRLKPITKGNVQVVNIDEHVDRGYGWDPRIKEAHCGSWVDRAESLGYLYSYKWIGNAKAFDDWQVFYPNYHPDLVHVCRSSPYLSTKGDGPFAELVVKLERAAGRKATIFGVNKGRLRTMINRRRAA